MADHEMDLPRWRESAAERAIRRLSTEVGPALRQARTLEEEIRALVRPLEPRARQWVLARWGVTQWPAPTLTVLGRHGGVGAERVRQVLALATYQLAVAAAHNGGLTRWTRLRDHLVASGVPLDSDALAAVRLGDLTHALGFRVARQSLRVLPALVKAGVLAAPDATPERPHSESAVIHSPEVIDS